jgi:hypothetical protein
LIRIVLILAGLAGLFSLAVFFLIFSYLFARTNLELSLSSLMKGVFAVDSVQMWWYITRAAGLVGFILLWLSTAWGLAISSKILTHSVAELHLRFSPPFSYRLDSSSISSCSLSPLSAIHADPSPGPIYQLLSLFVVGNGVISFPDPVGYNNTYIRQRIGVQTFRVIHIPQYVGLCWRHPARDLFRDRSSRFCSMVV